MQSNHPKPKLIVMLTQQDKIVPDALALFQRTKDYPIEHWGYNDGGLSTQEMQNIVTARKITFLEAVSLSEEDGLHGTRLAVIIGIDIAHQGSLVCGCMGSYDRFCLLRQEVLS